MPVVSGRFYPDQPDRLHTLLSDLLAVLEDCQRAPLPSSMSLVAPHAGYVYSGNVAAAGFAEVARYGRPDVVVILGASHTGVGPWFALSPHSAWETPLGRSPVHLGVMASLLDKGFTYDKASFEREHSVEVQLPFIQYLWGVETPIVPICVSPAPLSHVQEAARALSTALEGLNVLIIASSDFTHYEPDSQARATDAAALDRILSLDVRGFRQLCNDRQLTICGTAAIEALMSVALNEHWTTVQIVRYATSGDVTGDLSSVVGYASVLMTKENYG